MEGRILGGGWHVGIAVVEGCQTNRLLLLLVLHTLVLHPRFLVLQSEKGDGTMNSDVVMQNLFVVSVVRVLIWDVYCGSGLGHQQCRFPIEGRSMWKK
jgi:hypothetical protein